MLLRRLSIQEAIYSHPSVPGEEHTTILWDWCRLYCGTRHTWSFPSTPSLPLDSHQRATTVPYLGVQRPRNAETAQARARGTISTITALTQMHLYKKYICMRMFIPVYITQPGVFTIYLCTYIYFLNHLCQLQCTSCK